MKNILKFVFYGNLIYMIFNVIEFTFRLTPINLLLMLINIIALSVLWNEV